MRDDDHLARLVVEGGRIQFLSDYTHTPAGQA